MKSPTVPAPLLDAVKRDLAPVRPLASPVWRALAMLPLALALLVGLPVVGGYLTHSIAAPSSAWTGSVLETLLGLVVIAAAFREAVPGRALSRREVFALVGAACGVFVLVNATLRSPEGIASAVWTRWLWECVRMATMFSIPALIAPAWLVSRALPGRPALTGALGGLGIGLMSDAGMRLLCWDGDYLHVLAAHGGAIAILVTLGAASASLVERIRGR